MTVSIWRFLCVPHLYFIMISWLKCIKVIPLYFFFIYSHALHFAHCFHAEKTVTQIFILPIPVRGPYRPLTQDWLLLCQQQAKVNALVTARTEAHLGAKLQGGAQSQMTFSPHESGVLKESVCLSVPEILQYKELHRAD